MAEKDRETFLKFQHRRIPAVRRGEGLAEFHHAGHSCFVGLHQGDSLLFAGFGFGLFLVGELPRGIG